MLIQVVFIPSDMWYENPPRQPVSLSASALNLGPSHCRSIELPIVALSIRLTLISITSNSSYIKCTHIHTDIYTIYTIRIVFQYPCTREKCPITLGSGREVELNSQQNIKKRVSRFPFDVKFVVARSQFANDSEFNLLSNIVQFNMLICLLR